MFIAVTNVHIHMEMPLCIKGGRTHRTHNHHYTVKLSVLFYSIYIDIYIITKTLHKILQSRKSSHVVHQLLLVAHLCKIEI